MPPRQLAVPRGTFTFHAKNLPHRRSASQLALPPTTSLWRGQDPNTRIGHAITGAQEWQTSTYSFNKQSTKTLPVALTNVEKLIEAYVTMKKVNNVGKDRRAIRTALAARRKSAEKMYVSKPRVKDFGSRVEVTAFVFDGKEAAREADEKRAAQRSRGGRSGAEGDSKGGAGRKMKSDSDLVLDTEQQAGLQGLIARVYGKPVDLNLIKLRKPHLDADILAAVVAQRLRDRRNTPRRVIRDATWKAPLPNALTIANIQQAKLQRQPEQFKWEDMTMGNAGSTATSIMDKLALSQVSSVEVEAAGRLTKRLTANRSARKMARRGANAKGPGVMLRGFRKAHVQYAFAGGKRRVGQFGIRVSLGHA